MPWKECSVMDERVKFVARRLAGEAMADLCREFGISRKTGYKIFDRYQECGIQGLTDRSRRPYRYANQLPFQVENFILNVKHEHTSGGCAKDSRAPHPQVLWNSDSSQKHRPRGAGSSRPGGAERPRASSRTRHVVISGPTPRTLMHRLQGRVLARQSPILLSAHRNRPRPPFYADLRGSFYHSGKLRFPGV